ncbi:MAG: coenzyme F420-0:L-glutamate ligase [Candidatus Hodarchaeota archaeon]
MEIHAIRTRIIKPRENLVDILLESMEEQSLKLKPRDIIIVAETIMATSQGRIICLDDVTGISDKVKKIANKYEMDERIVKIVIDEAEEILGGVYHVLLTRAQGLLLANAGVDSSNSGGSSNVVLLPADIWGCIREFRSSLEKKTGIKPIGAILADSRVQPLKKGVIGGALSVSGFKPIEDKRGIRDIFGRPLEITQLAVADDLTSAAEILMGEANEQTPFVLIRDAPVTFVPDSEIDETSMLMPIDECLFMNVFKDYKKEELFEK